MATTSNDLLEAWKLRDKRQNVIDRIQTILLQDLGRGTQRFTGRTESVWASRLGEQREIPGYFRETEVGAILYVGQNDGMMGWYALVL